MGVFEVMENNAENTKLQIVPTKSVKSDIDWEKTHFVAINGDYSDLHKNNVKNAIDAANANKPAKIYVAGYSNVKTDYGPTKEEIKALIKKVGETSKKGDTVFIYITGHGEEDGFKINDKILTNTELIATMEKYLKGRKIVFVSDSCFSANFVNLIVKSKEFESLKAMSPGLKDEGTDCSHFADPFWNAIKTRMDFDKNGMATIDEAFRFGLTGYQKMKPGTNGTYRKSLDFITKIGKTQEEVSIVMVTAAWCGACKEMYNVLNSTQSIFIGAVGTYLMDEQYYPDATDLPFLLLVKNGKISATTVGKKSVAQMISWLSENGIKSGYDEKKTLEKLIENKQYEQALYGYGYAGLKKTLGAEKAMEILISLTKNIENEMLSAASVREWESVPKEDINQLKLETLVGELLSSTEEKKNKVGCEILIIINKELVNQITNEKTVNSLVRIIDKGKAYAEALDAFEKIVETNPKQNMKYLIELLKNNQENLRGAGCQIVYGLAIGQNTDFFEKNSEHFKVITSIVLILLDDKPEFVRQNALRALPYLPIDEKTCKKALPKIMVMAFGKQFEAEQAWKTLDMLAEKYDPTEIKEYGSLLEKASEFILHDSNEIRDNASSFFGKASKYDRLDWNEDLISALEENLTDKDKWVKRASLKAIAEIYENTPEKFLEKTDIIMIIISLFGDEDRKLAVSAKDVLTNYFAYEPQALIKYLPQLQGMLFSDSKYERECAISLLSIAIPYLTSDLQEQIIADLSKVLEQETKGSKAKKNVIMLGTSAETPLQLAIMESIDQNPQIASKYLKRMIDTGDNALKLEVVKIIENSVTENNTTHIELERLLKTLASEKDNEIKNHAERALRIMEGIKKRKN